MNANETPVEDVDFEIRVSADGRTLWVNGGEGGLIGRFSKSFGIDVHSTADEQMERGVECLYCTHEPAGEPEWDRFRKEMMAAYRIEIPADAIRFDAPGANATKQATAQATAQATPQATEKPCALPDPYDAQQLGQGALEAIPHLARRVRPR